jgi:mono/diheme cytochrome c family protein
MLGWLAICKCGHADAVTSNKSIDNRRTLKTSSLRKNDMSGRGRRLGVFFLACTCISRLATAEDLASLATRPEKTTTEFQSQEPAPFLSTENRERAILGHVDQDDIEANSWTISKLREAGRRLFLAQFTKKDGFGRPGATGAPAPTRRAIKDESELSHTAGPDASSCAACHRSPTMGGAGEATANVFVGLAERDPSIDSLSRQFSNERGTPELNGTAAIELLAREITSKLQSLRKQALEKAKATKADVRAPLVAKGIDFGAITASPDGNLRFEEVRGIDYDLVIRPFGQKGNIISLREFTINAANLHQGMQANERYGEKITGSNDFDQDGVSDELTTGDITALTVFQATLNMPGQVLPSDPEERALVEHGKKLFEQVRCSNCHIPELPLESSAFTEPSPYNIRGTLCAEDVRKCLTIDLAKSICKPCLTSDGKRSYVVRAFTDFKRHKISDSERPHFGNEILQQRFIPTDMFITRRLWAVGNTAPYGHRGDLPTIGEAIYNHGGEARDSRRLFDALSAADQKSIIAFLCTLQVVPDGSDPIVIERPMEQLPYTAKD